jgi:GTP cyclohydrolase I
MLPRAHSGAEGKSAGVGCASADQAIAALSTQAQPSFSDAETQQQAVLTLLIGLSQDPDRKGLLDTFYPLGFSSPQNIPSRVVKALKGSIPLS